MAKSVAVDQLVGRTVGRRRYEVVNVVAHGGMATVYRAHDRQLDRVVALKVPRPEFARDRAFAEQFRREARAAARLGHPNVVAVYDSGADRGLPWIVMEFVEGQTLRQLIDGHGVLGAASTAEILAQVAEALDHAHQAGVAHLDVKPENVLLGHESVKVADFGLVRAARARGADHQLVGTVQYLAPEVLRGGVVDGRADIYSLGVVAWECLVGVPPFDGDRETVIRRHLLDRVPHLSAARPGLPPALEAAVWRATEPDPAARFPRASDLTAAMGAPRRRRVDLGAMQATTHVPPAAGEATLDVDGDESSRPAARETTHVDGPAPALAAVPAPVPVSVGAIPAAHAPAPPRTGWASSPTAPPGTGAPVARPTTGHVPKQERRPSTLRRLALALAVAVLLVAAAAGAWQYVLPRPATVPNLAGATLGAARSALAREGLRLVRGGDAYSRSIPEGRVMAQSAGPGTRLHRRDAVTVGLSLGLPVHGLPALDGRPQATAEAELAALGLRTAVALQTDLEVPKGSVITTQPGPGAKVREQSVVTIVVSQGKPQVQVPEVKGSRPEQAAKALKAAGFTVTTKQAFSDTVRAGAVIGTEPPAGAKIDQGAQVQLLVSKGPDLVVVPMLRGMSRADAVATLEALGLKARFPYLAFGDIVIEQRQRPGTRVHRGSTVDLQLNVF